MVIKHLIKNYPRVLDVNVVNVDGCTPLDIARNNPSNPNHFKIRGLLRSMSAKTALKVSPALKRWKGNNKVENKSFQTWVIEMLQSLLVVATLLAAITYQGLINPPGGVFQDGGTHIVTLADGRQVEVHHQIGKAVMADHYFYGYFAFFNTLGLITSLSMILLLVSGLSFKRKITVWGFMIITWVAVTSVVGSFLCSSFILMPTGKVNYSTFWCLVNAAAFLIWLLLMLMVFGAHFFLLLRKMFYVLGISHVCQRVGSSDLFLKALDLFRKARERITKWEGHDDAEPSANPQL